MTGWPEHANTSPTMDAPTTAPEDGQSDDVAAVEKLPRTFGVKDLFTCINLLGGMAAIFFCMQGDLDFAGYALFLGFAVGDSLDGRVARLTNTANRFGAEFDTVTDHLTQCVAPACLIYVAYRDVSWLLAGSLATILVATGSIRHARGSVSPTNFPIAYIGLPRTVSGLVVVAFVNSVLFIEVPGGRWAGVPLLLFVSTLHLLPLPFRSHKGRPLNAPALIGVSAFFATTLAALLFFRTFVFDVLFFWTFGYICSSWVALTPDERRAFFRRAREWSEEVRRAR